MIPLKTKLSLPSAGLSGFEPPLTPDEIDIQAAVHRFAKDVLRPAGAELDRMTPEEAIGPDSPYWKAMVEYQQLGLDPEGLAQLPLEIGIRLESLIGEELGWGDAGLAVSIGAGGMPMLMAKSMQNQELIDLCEGKIGCWIITQPDRGSDVMVYDMEREWVPGVKGNVGNLTAKVVGDDIVINGQCSAWVSNGTVAQVALVNIAADYGDGFFDEDGRPHGLAAIVPLDLPGVSRGKPLDKIGQRPLPQGEIYFDEVRIPKRYATALKDEFYGNKASAWSYAGTWMSQVFTGVARAAFEHALQYTHERRQGGKLLIEHQMTRYRLGDMLRRIETSRAYARRSLAYARTSPETHPYVTAAAKVTVTTEAMAVVDEALQLFGATGLTREYPLEKLYRDCRAALIEDGENKVLTMRLGLLAEQLYADGWANA